VRLVVASEAFALNGVCYSGFPLILDDRMRLIEDDLSNHWFKHDRAMAFPGTMCGIEAMKASAALTSMATIRSGCPHR
jgi:hypothetical protein